MQHLFQLAAKQPVQPRPAAPLPAEEQGIVVERVAIHDRDRFGLIGDALQPLALGCGPGLGGQDALQGLVHPLVVGHQCIPQGRLADVPHDRGGHGLVGGFAPGRGQGGFVVAPLIEGEPEFAQVLAGEVPWPLQHGDEGRQSVAGIAHEGREPLQIVLRAGGIAIAPLDGAQRVVVIGEEQGLGGPVPLLIQQLSQAVDGSDQTAGLRDGQLVKAIDEVGGFLAGEQPKLGLAGFAEVPLLAPQLGNQLLAHEFTVFALCGVHLSDQLAEADFWVNHHRLHLGEGLQGLVDAHRVKDAEAVFANRLTQSRGAAPHLVVENAAIHSP